MVNWESGGVGEDNHSESPGVVRRGAMTPQWPSNRVYLFPMTSEMLCPERVWYTLPDWQWVVPTRHLTNLAFHLSNRVDRLLLAFFVTHYQAKWRNYYSWLYTKVGVAHA